jgi:hypothetical protein
MKALIKTEIRNVSDSLVILLPQNVIRVMLTHPQFRIECRNPNRLSRISFLLVFSIGILG